MRRKVLWNTCFHFSSDSPKNQILKPQVVCPAGKVEESVTLVGGITSGYFRDHGKVKDMQKCRRICCEMPHCHLAFMLSSNCFSVACKSASACKTQPANPSRYSPKISYVRNFDTNELLGKTLFQQLWSVAVVMYCATVRKILDVGAWDWKIASQSRLESQFCEQWINHACLNF